MNNSVNINTVNGNNCNVAPKDHAVSHTIQCSIKKKSSKYSCHFCTCKKYYKILRKGNSVVVKRVTKTERQKSGTEREREIHEATQRLVAVIKGNEL